MLMCEMLTSFFQLVLCNLEIQILQKEYSLSMKQIKMHLQTKVFFTQYGSRHFRFQRIKVIVNDINEIWSVDLAFVDKISKYNHGVEVLLVAFDCSSMYVRVESLKPNMLKKE